jgi:aminopeptidase N
MSQSPNPIYLKDYKIPDHIILNTHLIVDIFTEYTHVKSRLEIQAQTNQDELILWGEGLEFLSIKKDGKDLTSSDYSLSSDRLVVHRFGKKGVLEIENKIYPHLNKALEGFYQSGSIFCTQCEAEGFRKITYFIDRPDNMGIFTTKIIADKKRFPYLLANGNRIEAGDLANGRHFTTWNDPFKKPSYLFAMVAGDLEKVSDVYTTKTGRKVDIEFYVDHGQGYKCGHAINSLKASMRWDEETYGLEYDLNIYMVVAVESFNFGAMENKGLNIFNSAYVLADPKTATDDEFQNIESVIGHEYFHNWSGNRVTCRDWFQLTLKEGLTVYRDQEFSSDMLSRAVKRIEDVRRLKEHQFPEDIGPMSHPIRPSFYIEINNFYTATVYEKGAEVIRMIETILGTAHFKKGLSLYFKRHDGQAVTTDDFVKAMEDASGVDLKLFKNWYARPGTPELKCALDYDSKSGEATLKINQHYPKVGAERGELGVLDVPFKVALYNQSGEVVVPEELLHLSKLENTFSWKNLKEKPILSMNRQFTAPVLIDYPYSENELLVLMGSDNDPYQKSEAMQVLFIKEIEKIAESLPSGPGDLSPSYKKALEKVLLDKSIDDSLKTLLFQVPTDSQLIQLTSNLSIELICDARKKLVQTLGAAFLPHWKKLFDEYQPQGAFSLTSKAMGKRAFRNCCLYYLFHGMGEKVSAILSEFYHKSQTMTEEAFALSLFCQSSFSEKEKVLKHFYEKWKHEPLVMLRWFGMQASYAEASSFENLMVNLEKDPVFRNEVPNDLKVLYGQFSRNNLLAFHRKDGRGYEFLVERVKRIDRFNPQVASRLMSQFSLMVKLDENRRNLMGQSLKNLLKMDLSNDVFEVASKLMNQA